MKKSLLQKILQATIVSALYIVTVPGASAQTFYGDTVIVDLPPQQRNAFIKSIEEKVEYLQLYIQRISDKSIPIEERLEMIDSAIKLFSSENNLVQISNAVTGDVTQLPVRQYFRRLANIKATKVDITFYEGTKLEKLRRGSDMYYYGTALMFQETRIYKDPEGVDVYKDRTIKRVNFKSKQEFERYGDEKKPVMDTFLENINIKETISQ
jgi:hypothetical protein